jgi:hypothetical protein
MGIDFSCTEDPEWIREREIIWSEVEDWLKGDLRRKELNSLKVYFMTGVLEEGRVLSAKSKYGYFPIQNREGWDYVIENYYSSIDDFKSFVFDQFFDLSDRKYVMGDELELWDYFFGSKFEPTITSRVALAGTGQKVTIELDPLDVFCRIIPSIFLFLEKGLIENDSKWFQRIDYFWSLWPYITDRCFTTSLRRSTEGKTAFQVKRLLGHIVRYKPDKKFPDPDKTRPKFLKQLEEKLDEMYDQLCPMLQELWDETKVEKIKFEEKQAAQKAKRALARKKKAEEAKKAGGK